MRALFISFLTAVMANVTAYYICKWLDWLFANII